MLRNSIGAWLRQGEAVLTASRRLAQAVVLCTGGLGALLWIASGVVAQNPGPNRAALIVVHGDGRIVTRCIEFAEPQITGLDLVQRSGLDVSIDASSMGAAICRLDGEGCSYPQQSCFCQCEGEGCIYWSYWRSQAGAWVYSNLGASNTVVTSGVLEGWVWGAGTVDAAKSPPAISFDAICTAPTATSTATHTATYTASPTVDAGASATATSTATPTLLPTASATPTPFATAPAPATPTATATWTPTATPTITPPVASATMSLPPPAIALFAADRREIRAGETVILRWRVVDADIVTLQAEGKAVSIPTEGKMVLAPPQNTTYVLAAANADGAASTALTIIVRPQPQRANPLPSPGTSSLTPTDVELAAEVAAASPLPTPAAISPTMVATAPKAVAVAVAPTSTLTATPTPAPVVLIAVTPSEAMTTSAVSTQSEVAGQLLLTLVGGLILLGVPLTGLAMFLLFMALRRT